MNQVVEFMKKIKRRLHIGHADSSVGKSKLLASNKQTLKKLPNIVKQQAPSNNSAAVAMIYRSELDYISRCILDSTTIETGGQLFGFWTSTGIPVVLYAIGPGPLANHQVTFFNQDVDYLLNVGTALLQRYGLQHIGEWHSHHQLGLAHPSGHDASNMQMVVNQKHLGKFLLCIGNCDAHASTLNAFNFMEGEQSYQQASWMIKEMDSPYRRLVDNELRNILVHPHCMAPNMIGLKILEEDKPLFKHDYWLCDKQNNLALKKIVDFLCQLADNMGCEVKLDSLGYVHLFVNKSGESKEEIFFPMGFPHEAPEVKRQSGVCVTEEWNYCGDIYQAFVQYYCGCLPSPPQKDEILWNEQNFLG